MSSIACRSFPPQGMLAYPIRISLGAEKSGYQNTTSSSGDRADEPGMLPCRERLRLPLQPPLHSSLREILTRDSKPHTGLLVPASSLSCLFATAEGPPGRNSAS